MSRHHHLTRARRRLLADRRRAVRRGGRGAAALLVAGQPVPLRGALDQRDRGRGPAGLLGLDPAAARRLAEGAATCSRTTPDARPPDRLAPGVPRRVPEPWLVGQQPCDRRGRRAGSPRPAPSPGTPQTPRWREDARPPCSSSELAANTFASGLNRELATDYHRFVLELGLVAAVEADAHGASAARGDLASGWPGCWTPAAAMLDVAGRPPRQGDGDEGRALVRRRPGARPLGGRCWPAARAVLGAPATGGRASTGERAGAAPRARLGRPRPSSTAPAGRGRAGSPTPAWSLLRTPARGRAGDLVPGRRRAARLPVDRGARARRRAVDRAAPRRRRDPGRPGTYCYHGEPEWRQWFRSTAAHNTLEIGGRGPVGVRRAVPLDRAGHATTTLACDVGHASGADLGGRARRLPTAEPGRRAPALGHPGLAGPGAHRRRHAGGRGPVPVRLSWHLGPDVGSIWTARGRAHLVAAARQRRARPPACRPSWAGRRTGARRTRSGAGTRPGSGGRSRASRWSGTASGSRDVPGHHAGAAVIERSRAAGIWAGPATLTLVIPLEEGGHDPGGGVR